MSLTPWSVPPPPPPPKPFSLKSALSFVCRLYGMALAVDMMNVDSAPSAARRRRERRLRQFLRHERMTVAMVLSEKKHHTSRGQNKDRTTGEENVMNYTAKLRKTPPPTAAATENDPMVLDEGGVLAAGGLPAPLSEVAGRQEKVVRHVLEDLGSVCPVVQILDLPVPHMMDQLAVLRHERMTVRMGLAAALHHSRDVGPGKNDGLRAQKTVNSREDAVFFELFDEDTAGVRPTGSGRAPWATGAGSEAHRGADGRRRSHGADPRRSCAADGGPGCGQPEPRGRRVGRWSTCGSLFPGFGAGYRSAQDQPRRHPSPLLGSFPEPQLAEQLVEVPTIVSFSSLERIMEQTVDIPVPQGGGGRVGVTCRCQKSSRFPRTEFNSV